MIPTRRLAWLGAIATVVAMVAAYFPPARPPLFAIDAVIFFAVVVDALIARGTIFRRP